MMNQRQFLC